MGSGHSHLGSRPSRSRVNRRKRGLVPFLCGNSRSHAPLDNDDEMDDNLFEVSANSTGHRDFVIDNNLQSSVKESLSLFSSENECSSSMGGNGASSEHNYGIPMEENSIECGSRSHGSNDAGKSLSESNELVPCQVHPGHSAVKSYREKTRDIASTSKELQPLESTSTNVDTRLDLVVEAGDSTNEESSHICIEGLCPSSMSQQELGHSSVPNHTDEVLGTRNSNTSSISAVSSSSLTSQLHTDESLREAATASSGFLLPTTRQSDRRNGNVLHVDVVSISSDALPSSTGEISSHGARRNGRRLFWDAFSRRSSRRNSDSPTMVFSAEDTVNVGSHDRWLLDISGDLFDNGIENLGYRSRSRASYERRWHSRSEIWERLRGGHDEHRGRPTFCANGLHPYGTCSCETFSEESATRANFSRIVMLAEALFEVLDEIHRQPISLSLSMVSLPAPESVVDSFPLKSHKKPTISESRDDVEQCYICLAEYEEGDKIRVLPCRHEYHMSCVDKWLKEIHGVCPLCRGDVCEGIAGASISNS